MTNPFDILKNLTDKLNISAEPDATGLCPACGREDQPLFLRYRQASVCRECVAIGGEHQLIALVNREVDVLDDDGKVMKNDLGENVTQVVETAVKKKDRAIGLTAIITHDAIHVFHDKKTPVWDIPGITHHYGQGQHEALMMVIQHGDALGDFIYFCSAQSTPDLSTLMTSTGENVHILNGLMGLNIYSFSRKEASRILALLVGVVPPSALAKFVTLKEEKARGRASEAFLKKMNVLLDSYPVLEELPSLLTNDMRVVLSIYTKKNFPEGE